MKYPILIFLLAGFIACSSPEPIPSFEDKLIESGLSEEELHDKILGMIVGGAIGDAMGAPTEMWPRESIQAKYGFVRELDSLIREASPEGTWLPNLPEGGTTDDTRWKVFTSEFLTSQKPNQLNPKDFARKILETYNEYLEEFYQLDSLDTYRIEEMNLKLGWLQEWAKVSQPFIANNLSAYADSLGKFYGGEMVCAGLLYAPALGAYFPGNPEKAYQEAYKLSIYDLGYAKDLTALSAAMTAAGMKKGASSDSLLTSLQIDPMHYFESRLVGRTANRIINDALFIVEEAKKLDSLGNHMDPESPALNFAYSQLDARIQDMPFHAGEIFLQTLTAMIYSDFDFMNTLIFLTNYGRDNDTTAALAGSILGAYYGFGNLPEKEKHQVLSVNKNLLEINLERTADDLSNHLLGK
ncbi:ADP-ribosylglycohydrolase family protein [Algoriphagus kandeliae]|uniref:ADP-ribosylglycohydrolase family protein n=1 Tax=Algoriphagus kandeliae TaxID=2562278 RepID=A0A4Y9QYA0_9BACT|nr:ADP-ribosylglycohydrolase family protein [Algoriphagus kandeliae]TFV97461.1 ADP-ribosylglycohydrolase family protein [Algoriphagus kandeliae]